MKNFYLTTIGCCCIYVGINDSAFSMLATEQIGEYQKNPLMQGRRPIKQKNETPQRQDIRQEERSSNLKYDSRRQMYYHGVSTAELSVQETYPQRPMENEIIYIKTDE